MQRKIGLDLKSVSKYLNTLEDWKRRVVKPTVWITVIQLLTGALTFLTFYAALDNLPLGPLATQTAVTGMLIVFYIVTSLLTLWAFGVSVASNMVSGDLWVGPYFLPGLFLGYLIALPSALSAADSQSLNQLTQTIVILKTQLPYPGVDVLCAFYSVVALMPIVTIIGYFNHRQDLKRETQWEKLL